MSLFHCIGRYKKCWISINNEIKFVNIGRIDCIKDVFNALVKIRKELDQIESIEIMNDKKLMEGIDRAMKDVEKGKIYELEDIDELF